MMNNKVFDKPQIAIDIPERRIMGAADVRGQTEK